MDKRLLTLLLLTSISFAASPEKVYKESKDKVVKLGMVGQFKNKYTGKTIHWRASCSGALIDEKGTVLTCAHCLSEEGMTKVFVKLANGEVYPGIVHGIDTQKDLALVSFLTPYYQPHFNFGKSVKIGQQVYSFGSPLGILQNSFGVGWVGNIWTEDEVYIVHSAFIAPGSSGGPLVDGKGRLVGINAAGLMENFLIPAAGFYVAIDLSVIRAFLGGR